MSRTLEEATIEYEAAAFQSASLAPTELEATVIISTTTQSSSSSAGSNPSLGWIIAAASLSLTALVMFLFVAYFIYDKIRRPRLAEQRRQQLEQDEAEKEKREEEMRARKIKDQLRLMKFSVTDSGNGSGPHSKVCRATKLKGEDMSSETEVDTTSSTLMNHEYATVDPEAQTSRSNDDNAIDNDNDEDDENYCLICFGSYKEGDLLGVSNNSECKHAFHHMCIREWLLKQDGCPVCRRLYLKDHEGRNNNLAKEGSEASTENASTTASLRNDREEGGTEYSDSDSEGCPKRNRNSENNDGDEAECPV